MARVQQPQRKPHSTLYVNFLSTFSVKYTVYATIYSIFGTVQITIECKHKIENN